MAPRKEKQTASLQAEAEMRAPEVGSGRRFPVPAASSCRSSDTRWGRQISGVFPTLFSEMAEVGG